MKKISALSAFKQQSDKAPSHPIYNYPHAEDIDTFIELDAKITVLTAKQEVIKADVKEKAAAYWFDSQAGKTSVVSSLLIPNSEGDQCVMVTVQNKYRAIDESSLKEVLTKKQIEDYFDHTFSLTIKGEAIPEKKREEFVTKLVELTISMGLKPADIVEAKEKLQPKPTFHEQRHSKLSLAENKKLSTVCQPTITLKVDGVKS